MNSAKRVSNQSLKKADNNKNKTNEGAKSRSKLGIAIVSACAAVLVVLIGLICWEDLHPRIILTVNGEKIYLSDMMYDIYMTEQTGEYMNQYYAQSNGGNYWEAESVDGMTNAELLKDNTVESVMQRAMMYNEAVAAGYTLTEEEATAAEDNATQSFESLTATVENKTGQTKQLIIEHYQRKTLADRYKQDWIDSFDIDDAAITADISEEDFRQYDIQYYYIPFTKTDDAGQESDMTDAEKEKAVEELKASYDDIAGLEDFTTYIQAESAASGDAAAEPTATPAPGPKAPADTNIKYTTKSFIETDEVAAFDEDMLVKIKGMKKDEISKEVVQDSNGCYIFKMVDNNNSERYESECANAISDAEQKEFSSKIDELEVDKYTIELNEDEWDRVEFGKVTIDK